MTIHSTDQSVAGQPGPQPGPDLAARAPEPGLTFQKAAGESNRAFEAFVAYWKLGPRRRYAATARHVGASLRTVKGWAADFDWSGRIKSCAVQQAEFHQQFEEAADREELLDAAARLKALRDRQCALAEAMLDAAERFLENVVDDDLDRIRFADACKALEVASRLTQQVAQKTAEEQAAQPPSLQDKLSALLDQAFGKPAQPADAASSQAAGPQPSEPSK
jgi:hypothetical protein